MASNGGFGSIRHLAGRFFGALDPRGPAPEEEEWAMAWLLPGEQDLWRRMSGPDRRHAAAVARDVGALLGPPEPGREVMASALLHDVGKVASGLGTFARAGVTAAALGVGRERLMVGPTGSEPGSEPGSGSGSEPGWGSRWRWRQRVSDYLAHDRIGAELLEAAGSDPTTVAWAAEHHQPPEQWSIDRKVADALKAADGD